MHIYNLLLVLSNVVTSPNKAFSSQYLGLLG